MVKITKRTKIKPKKIKAKKAVTPPADGHAMEKTFKDATEANNIRNWRIFRGIKDQGALGALCGLGRVTINRLELGTTPYRQDYLQKISKVLGCTPAELIDTNPNEPSIFRIYKRLSPKNRSAVDKLLRSLSPFVPDLPYS